MRRKLALFAAWLGWKLHGLALRLHRWAGRQLPPPPWRIPLEVNTADWAAVKAASSPSPRDEFWKPRMALAAGCIGGFAEGMSLEDAELLDEARVVWRGLPA